MSRNRLLVIIFPDSANSLRQIFSRNGTFAREVPSIDLRSRQLGLYATRI